MIYPSPLFELVVWTLAVFGEIFGDQTRTESISKKHKFYPECGVFQTV